MSDSTVDKNLAGEATAVGEVNPATTHPNPASSPAGKGKGKATAADDSMDIDEDDEEEDDDDDEEDDDEDDDEDEDDIKDEIDPQAIIPEGRARRTRPQVDYSSAEAHAKAGLKPGEEEEEE
ncbi:unnamed protein product [Rhizoctonia solani]|uniref:Histone chaperone domain-containing protein n=1 Tax=Rhizoctonia solani TaxID=456999 RepID=A0A8H3GEB7_9AGAM|nr:unnamed protein product [Rhizoctonia solani]